MDALLAVSVDGLTLPGVGEIKAATERVGLTFALVQALMNASLLTTASQFRRLSIQPDKEYVQSFGNLVCENPKVDIVLLIDKQSELIQEDVQLANELRVSLQRSLSEHIRSIHFFKATEDAHFEPFVFESVM